MSYITDHPTSFVWRPDVKKLVQKYQNEFKWLTWIGTYWWHPPYDPPSITRRYDAQSFDVWGGGVVNGVYRGYRGRTLPLGLGNRIHKRIFNDPNGPAIDWIIWQGWLWSRWSGWSRFNPPDPYNADMGHFRHIHITFQ